MTWTIQPRSEGGGDLRYFEHGQGIPLVLVHGVGLRAEAWNAFCSCLSDTFRVIAVDIPGHGASDLKNSKTLADFTARLTSFISALDQPVYVAGHSMGALLTVEVAAALPGHVRAAAALNTVYRRHPDAARAVQERADVLTRETSVDPAPTLERWFGTTPTGNAKAAADACRIWLTQGNMQGYATAYRIFAHEDGPSQSTLDLVSCPILFLTGADDPNSTPAMSKALAKQTKGTCEVIPAAAHMLPMTHPEALASALKAAFSHDLNRF